MDHVRSKRLFARPTQRPPPAMETEAGCAGSRKRKLALLEAPAPAAAELPGPESAVDGQDPPLPGTDGGAGDRISHLPDGILGDIISLLPTKEGARTQILASRWHHLWRSAPLNLDHHGLCQDRKNLEAVVSRILSAHPGPGRRFCAPVYHLHGDRAATADSWLQSPALDNLQELELSNYDSRFPCPPVTPQLLPAAAFRFCDTLCVAIIGHCQLPDSIAQALHFPKLKKLKLEQVSISESSLHTMIAGCPVLRCLLIQNCSGFRCLRITSASLRGIGCDCFSHCNGLQFGELIIENAPCLERLFELGSGYLDTSVIFAPKLGTLGCLSSVYSNRLAFGSTVIQGLRVDSLTSAVYTVKILAVDLRALSLDAVIDLMRCFPYLESLYIESVGPGKTNFWRCKHQEFIRSSDIRLKKISWRYYRGIKSHVDFATFFVLNARVLKLMTLQVNKEDHNEEFFAQQRKMLQLDSKASRGAQLHFTTDPSHRYILDFGVHCLDLADPFEWKYPSEFYALS
ncbi:hypothetical protein ACQ4PT_059661 [Festuca glaucescens]